MNPTLPFDGRSARHGTAALLLAALVACPGAFAQIGTCTVLPLTDEGPWDYRAQNPRMKMMEGFHFTPKVEALIAGQSEVSIAKDLEFVLRYTPNHHRALDAFTRLAKRERTTQPRGAQYSVKCHFERAIAYQPEDAVARMLFANYLVKSGQEAEGMKHLDIVKEQQATNAFTQYNVGLVYLEAGKHEQALEQAHRAMALGFPRTDLRDKLMAAGRWQDPPKAGE